MPEKKYHEYTRPGKKAPNESVKNHPCTKFTTPPPRKSQMVSLGVIFFGLPPFTILHLQLGTHV